MAAEAEGVVRDGVDFHLAGLVGYVVEVAVRVGGLVVDGRRDGAGLDRLAAGGHFDSAGGTEHVPGCSLGGADGQASGVFTKNRLDGLGFADVALRGGGAVGVDVGNVVRVESAGVERHAHGACAAFAFRRGGGHVVGVGGVAVAGQLTIDPRAACGGVLEGLEHQYAGSFAHDEAVSPGVKRPGGVPGIVIAGAERFHRGKATHGGGQYSGLGAAGEHDVCLAHDERAPRLSDGVVGGGAGGAGGDVGAAQALVK